MTEEQIVFPHIEKIMDEADKKEDFKFLAALFVHAQLSNPNKMSGIESQREVIETAISIARHLLVDLQREDQ